MRGFQAADAARGRALRGIGAFENLKESQGGWSLESRGEKMET